MKLNLHLHTRYSDGCDTLQAMAEITKSLDHVALVVSDHDYCMTPFSYRRQRAEAKKLTKQLKFPIICGLEISLYHEEAVLIGAEACRAWLHFRKRHKLKTFMEVYRFNPTIEEVTNLLKPFNYGLCLVHPGLRGSEELYKLFHCHEIMNGGCEWPPESQQKLKELAPQSKPVRGIDAHSAKGYLMRPECLCNEVEAGVWDEDSVIKWMRSSK